MISRAILLSTAIGWSGFNLMPVDPTDPVPMTAAQLQQKAKQASRSNVCLKKKKSKTVHQLCKDWENQQKLTGRA